METNLNITCLKDLLYEDISRMANAEEKLKNSIAAWVNHQTASPLRELMDDYQDVIECHIKQLDNFCADYTRRGHKLLPAAMNALAADADEKLAACANPGVRNACLLGAVQNISHYKISIYGTAAAYASTIRLQAAGLMFHQAELDEKEIDERLSYLAEHELNKKAAAPALLSIQY